MSFNQAYGKITKDLEKTLGDKRIYPKWNRQYPEETLFNNSGFDDV